MTSRTAETRATKRGSWLTASGLRARLFAVAAILAVATTGSIVGQAAAPAYAIEYPSWDDVLAARSNEQAKQAEISRIQALLAQLEQQVTAAQALEVQRGEEYFAAQQALDEASFKADQLQQQADAAKAIADESKLRAGQLAARLARTGGEDLSATLFFDGASADDLLSQLGMASKISDQSAGVYEKAARDQNTAQDLTDDAKVARDARAVLAKAAEEALAAAVAASEAARAAVAEQQANAAILAAQLDVLSQNREAVEADFQAGERAREAERQRLAEIERLAREQEAANRAAAGGGGGGGGGGASTASAGQVSGAGWARPSGGYVNSTYGWRIHPIYKDRRFHAGSDISAGCGWPIYAASAGTVTYSGWNGGYGNYIGIAHAGGASTAYGHIVNGGLLVRVGQQVNAGDLIARVGTTGGSTGCHLHFEVRVNGSTTDPVPFMRARGVNF